MTADLVFKSVSKSIRSRRILHGASLTVRAGEMAVIIGPSGSGKSTTLRLINRLQEMDSGDILVGGRSILALRPTELRRLVGFIPQVPVMFDGSVMDNIVYGMTLGAQVAREIAPETRARALELLRLADLNDSFVARDASKLSVGEQQRVALARALLLSPEILLMDEPTAALDPMAVEHVEEAIRKINRTIGTTFLMVSHSPEQAIRLGRRIFWLSDGRLREIRREEVFDFMRGVKKGMVSDDD